MLGLDNPIHIAFVLVLLLLVFGAKRLPEMGKSMGAGLRGFKEAISGDEPMTHLTEAHAAMPADEPTWTHTAPAQPVAAPAQPVAAPSPEPVAEHPTMQPAA